MAQFIEYDIEVLENIFTLAVYRHNDDKTLEQLHIYYYVNQSDNYIFESPNGDVEDGNKQYISPQQLADLAQEHVLKHNRIFKGKVTVFSLRTLNGVLNLLNTFGISNDKTNSETYNSNTYTTFVHNGNKYSIPHFTRDVDTVFDKDVHPFLVSYNGFQYDTTVLAQLYDEMFTEPNDKGEFELDDAFTTKAMRVFNDQLFTKQFKSAMYTRLRFQPTKPNRVHTSYGSIDYNLPANLFRTNMIQSGRYVDAARLNEKMTKVPLKRLLGMLGCQIMESDKLKPTNPRIENLDELLDLFAYNASDVINLHTLMTHKVYISAFEAGDNLLEDYPELVYTEKGNTYKPNISPDTVRQDRLYRDSTSQQQTAKSLFPYSNAKDYKYVDFMYPAQSVCDKYNEKYVFEIKNGERKPLTRSNVLDNLKEFFYDLFPQQELRNKFDKIYNHYKNLEGRNFNKSKQYQKEYPNIDAENMSDFPFTDSYICYYDKDGNPTRHYANFSIGGIHGAEWNMELFELDRKRLFNYNVTLDKIKKRYPNPVDFRKAQVNIKTKGRKSKVGYVLIDGVYYKTTSFLKPQRKVEDSEYRDHEYVPDTPFKRNSNGLLSLDKKYVYTTVAEVNHEDFSSYYPNLLIMMAVFFNERLGYDRYNEIYELKEKYGDLMEDESLSKEERELYAVRRTVTKLLLNAATGGADAAFDTNISANNAIISMRIIGNCFTYMVGQYQAYHGAGVPSTNTDGLYTQLEATFNDKLLAEIAEQIHVAIKPERMYLISKDANNRAEMKINDDNVVESIVSAGSIGCYNGPEPTKSLSHPAIIDKVLVDYMIEKAIHQGDTQLKQPFDRKLAKQLMIDTINPLDNKKRLIYLQNILTSTSTSYIFTSKDMDGSNPDILQMYNRVFMVTDDDPHGVYAKRAVAQAITPATANKRKRNKEIAQQHDPAAKAIMAEHGFTDFEPNTEATIVKIPGLPDDKRIRINNSDLGCLTDEEAMDIINHIDIDAYIDMFESAYNNSWKNTIPENTVETTDESIITLDNYNDFVDMSDDKSAAFIEELKEVA